MSDEERQQTNDNHEKEISKKSSSDSAEISLQNTSSTQNETADSSLKRKHSPTEELVPQSVKHRRFSDDDDDDVVGSEHTNPANTSKEETTEIGTHKTLESLQELEVYFSNISRPVNSNYQSHVIDYICNNYRFAYKSELKRICKKYNFHLMPSLKELHTEEKLLSQRQTRRQYKDLPKERDETFYLELGYIDLKADIDICCQRDIDEILEQFSIIKNLTSCNFCYKENLSQNDLVSCFDGHEFCKTCVRKLVKINVVRGNIRFCCLNVSCRREYSLYALEQCLDITNFSSLVNEIKIRNILIAGIADVVTCPMCLTNTMRTDHDDEMLLFCINPRCRRTTCRYCKRLNHLPIICKEWHLVKL